MLTMEDVMPQLKDIAPDDFASMEKLLPGEGKKSHPESHSMVHHTTKAEHVAAILKSRVKRERNPKKRLPKRNQSNSWTSQTLSDFIKPR